MSDFSVIVSPTNPTTPLGMVTSDQLKYVMMMLEKGIHVGKLLSGLTSTTVDDKAIEWAEKLIGAIKPVVDEAWFAELVNLLTGLFSKPDTALVALAKLKS